MERPELTAYFQSENERPRPEIISAEFLQELFSSERFRLILERTRKKVEGAEGREFGFVIMKDVSSDEFFISEPGGGEEENETALGVQEGTMRKRLEKRYPKKKFVAIASLHFHPQKGQDPPIIPSGLEGDIGIFTQTRVQNIMDHGYDIPPIEMIAARKQNDELKILALQESINKPPLYEKPYSRAELSEALFDARKDVDVLDVLREEGFRAEFIETKDGQLSPQAIDVLSKFAFEPRKVKEEVF